MFEFSDLNSNVFIEVFVRVDVCMHVCVCGYVWFCKECVCVLAGEWERESVRYVE